MSMFKLQGRRQPEAEHTRRWLGNLAKEEAGMAKSMGCGRRGSRSLTLVRRQRGNGFL
jgi:hypothetical protein